MAMLKDTTVEVIVKIGLQGVTVWEGRPPEKAVIAAARISANEITLFVGPEESDDEEQPKDPA